MAVIFESLAQDIKYALRGLRTKPGFAIAVVSTLALGIGANAAMFGIVDRLLFRPPARLIDPATTHRVYLYRTFRGVERASSGFQYARYLDYVSFTRSFSRLAAYTPRDLAVGVGEASREMHIGVVSASFFGFFDATPALGRYFTQAEDSPPDGSPVTVLSYGMWQAQYGGRRDVIGSTVHIGPLVYTIIGVAPPGFVGVWADQPPAAFIPITTYAATQASVMRFSSANWWKTYSWSWMNIMVRRKPGVTVAAANADLTQASVKSWEQQTVEQSRATPLKIARPHAVAASILAERGPNESSTAKVATWVAGVSLIVLIIACANVANLLLARALRRRREVALRLALGVTRGRLLSQLLTESLVLAVIGGVLGLLVAHWGGAALRAGLLQKSEAAAGLRDSRTVLFAFIAAIAVGLLTGLAPALQARRADLTADLKTGSREGTFHRSRTRTALLVLQGTLSVVLLVGAGLFVRSLQNVRAVRLGYDVNPIVLVSINMRGERLDTAATIALRERLMRAAKAVPGVDDASLQTSIPFWSMWSVGLHVEGIDSVSRLGQFDLNAVSPEFFHTFGTRIRRGRGLTEQDTKDAPRAAVVSEAMGKVLWPGKDPIGQCMIVGADTMPCTYVVGVAENIREQSLADTGYSDKGYFYYMPVSQYYSDNVGLFVRVRGDGRNFTEPLRRALQHEMPGASYVSTTPFSDIIGSQTRSWTLGATMFVAFGLLALVLAAVGLYSVIAYNVAQRAHELGVRRALGAQAADVARLVVIGGLRVAGTGVALGVLAALWAAKWVKPLLFGVSPRDAGVFVTVAVLLIAVAIAASWVPALRATRVDPNVALRSE